MEFPDELVIKMSECDNMVVLTGAGISAESGIPVFRGPEGIWAKYRPEELATPAAFSADPKLVWAWYSHRRYVIRQAKPNAGHTALVRMENSIPSFLLVTQNVDGLHRLAGSRNVYELHGNIRINRCVRCSAESSMDDDPHQEEIPKCSCGGMLRPGVVWFGESLPEGVFEAAAAAVRSCQVLLVVGTSAVVYPAASLPDMAIGAGAMVVEVNPQETPLTKRVSMHLRGTAAEILPRLAAVVEASPSRS